VLHHNPEFDLNDILIIKNGRYSRITPSAVIVIGRDEKENNNLLKLVKNDDFLFYPCANGKGPVAIGRGLFSEEEVDRVLAMIAGYCKFDGSGDEVGMMIEKLSEGRKSFVPLTKIKKHEILQLRN